MSSLGPLLASIDSGAIKGREKAILNGEAATDTRGVETNGLGATDEASPLERVVDASEEVKSKATDSSPSERATGYRCRRVCDWGMVPVK